MCHFPILFKRGHTKKGIQKWKVSLHFSPSRNNLINWLIFQPFMKVGRIPHQDKLFVLHQIVSLFDDFSVKWHSTPLLIVDSNKASQTFVVGHGIYLDNSSCMQFWIKKPYYWKKHYCAPTIVVAIVITIVEADEATVKLDTL